MADVRSLHPRCEANSAARDEAMCDESSKQQAVAQTTTACTLMRWKWRNVSLIRIRYSDRQASQAHAASGGVWRGRLRHLSHRQRLENQANKISIFFTPVRVVTPERQSVYHLIREDAEERGHARARQERRRGGRRGDVTLKRCASSTSSNVCEVTDGRDIGRGVRKTPCSWLLADQQRTKLHSRGFCASRATERQDQDTCS